MRKDIGPLVKIEWSKNDAVDICIAAKYTYMNALEWERNFDSQYI